MENKLALALFFGILIGCATTRIAQVTPVDAQPRGPGEFRECVAYVLDVDRDFDDLARNAKPIPAGWTPVGGAGGTTVILCR